jgi:hypothetical protein
MIKPSPCREIGCGGCTCKYYKSVEEYPYFKCMYWDMEFKSETMSERNKRLNDLFNLEEDELE